MKKSSLLLIFFGWLVISFMTVASVNSITPYPYENWSFIGSLGVFDIASSQRGYAVYDQVCSRCHSLRSLTYQDLVGLGLTTDQVRMIAAAHTVKMGLDKSGNPQIRPAGPQDPFVLPDTGNISNFPRQPPDLSRIVMTLSGGVNELNAILQGFAGDPAAQSTLDRKYYNKFIDRHLLAMPPSLTTNGIIFADSVPPTVAHQARDVSTFLAWISYPHLAQRHRIGIGVVVYIFFLIMLVTAWRFLVWNKK